MRDTERNWPSASPEPPATPSGAPRTQIGPYQLIAKIGEGGMGTVWLTKLPGPAGFNKLAVVKELRADLAGSPAFVEMFLNEARLAARLTHPNVIHTYGANEDRGRLYIAMEYLDGQPWSQVRHALWANRSLPLALHLKVLVDTLTGLHYAHELRDYDGTPLQVVHRDMSPQNVFVTYDGLVKVVDFGVARAVMQRLTPLGSLPPPPPPAGSLPPRTSQRPMFVGKVAYSGPEQIRGEAIDRRADVFAVGVMLWEALAGRRLMELDANQDRTEAVRKRASEPAPRIRDVVSSMPRLLSDICDRALALDPNDRFSTAAEFRDAIKAYLDENAPDLDSAQLGQLVSTAFRDERTRINGLIERSLMRSTPTTSPPPVESLIDTLRPPPESGDHTIRADLSELASVSRLEDEDLLKEATNSSVASIRSPLDPPLAEPNRDKKKKQLVLAAIGAGALLLVWIVYRVATQPQDEVTAQPLPPTPAEVAATSPPSVVARPSEIKLEISAKPANASIFLDGAPLQNPFSGQLKTDGEMHILRVSAPGMQTQEKVVQLDSDKSLFVELLTAATQPLQGSAAGQHVGRPLAGPRPRAQAPQQQQQPARSEAPREGREGDPDFDSRITPESKQRPIYEEDPY
jgi:serine/threonine protein kinase